MRTEETDQYSSAQQLEHVMHATIHSGSSDWSRMSPNRLRNMLISGKFVRVTNAYKRFALTRGLTPWTDAKVHNFRALN